MRALILAALCASLPFTASAQAFRSESRLDVFPINATDFEVVQERSQGPRGIWCAASDYARSRLTNESAARMYIKSGSSPSARVPGRKSVIFTLDPSRLSASPNQGLSVSINQVGYNLRVSHAYSFCADFRFTRSGLSF